MSELIQISDIFKWIQSYNNHTDRTQIILDAMIVHKSRIDFENEVTKFWMASILRYEMADAKSIQYAIQIFQELSDVDDDLKSHNELGLCYFNGIGVDRDIKKAITLFEKSKNIDSVFNLGMCYIIPELYDAKRAAELIVRAHRRSSSKAERFIKKLSESVVEIEQSDRLSKYTDQIREIHDAIQQTKLAKS